MRSQADIILFFRSRVFRDRLTADSVFDVTPEMRLKERPQTMGFLVIGAFDRARYQVISESLTESGGSTCSRCSSIDTLRERQRMVEGQLG